MRLAPAATSGARFCGELVGARKHARHSNFRFSWFRVRSQSLPSLGAFGAMVLVRQAHQSGTFRGVFCIFHFLRRHGASSLAAVNTSFCRFQARSRGLQSLGEIRPMVFVQRARQNGSNRAGVLLHQVCKVCIWHTQCTLCYQLVETNAYFMQTMLALGEDSKYAH